MLNQNALLSAEMLNMLNVLGEIRRCVCVPLAREFNIFNISAERSIFLRKCASFRGNVEYVEFWGPMLNRNVLLSAEMLNMLNVLGEIRR